LQTFGGYAANFHPHVHALITEGAFHDPRSAAPSFDWVAGWDVTAIAELFRRRVLARLRQGRRLREHTEQMLLSWEHSGFSVWAGEPIRPGGTERKEHVARYVTRAPVRLDAIERKDQGKVLVQTPYDPRTGQRTFELDDLELIRRLCAQIPAPRQHLVRYFGWYSSRARGDRGRRKSEEGDSGAPRPEVRTDAEHRDDSPAARSRRRSWARLLRRIFEIDPLLCPRYGGGCPGIWFSATKRDNDSKNRQIALRLEISPIGRPLSGIWTYQLLRLDEEWLTIFRMTANELYPRLVQARLREALAESPVVLLHGPRQWMKQPLFCESRQA